MLVYHVKETDLEKYKVALKGLDKNQLAAEVTFQHRQYMVEECKGRGWSGDTTSFYFSRYCAAKKEHEVRENAVSN